MSGAGALPRATIPDVVRSGGSPLSWQPPTTLPAGS